MNLSSLNAKLNGNNVFNNKLFAIKPNFNDKYNFHCNRKDQTILTRCRIGHSRFSHMHLLNNERAPQCINCNEHFNYKTRFIKL